MGVNPRRQLPEADQGIDLGDLYNDLSSEEYLRANNLKLGKQEEKRKDRDKDRVRQMEVNVLEWMFKVLQRNGAPDWMLTDLAISIDKERVWLDMWERLGGKGGEKDIDFELFGEHRELYISLHRRRTNAQT